MILYRLEKRKNRRNRAKKVARRQCVYSSPTVLPCRYRFAPGSAGISRRTASFKAAKSFAADLGLLELQSGSRESGSERSFARKSASWRTSSSNASRCFVRRRCSSGASGAGRSCRMAGAPHPASARWGEEFTSRAANERSRATSASSSPRTTSSASRGFRADTSARGSAISGGR